MSIKKQVISGVKWTTVSAIALALTAILKVSILARFLDRSDFGLVAMVTFVLGFMELFNDMGLTSAILHKQEIKVDEYSSLYWLNMSLSFGIYGLLLLTTPLVASFYSQPQLNDLIPLLGLNLLISGFGRQFKVVKQKELKFGEISIIEIAASILSLGAATILAMQGYGVYALVYAAVLQFVVANLAFFIIGIRNHPIKLHFRLSETRPFLKIGIYQVGGQIANYFNRDLDILLIGKFFSADILGGYSLAKQLVFRPAQFINPIVTKVASPALAKYQGDKLALKQNYLKLVNIISSINIPIYLAIIVLAPWAVRVMYGPDFENIVMLVRILSVYMIFRAVGNPVGSLVIASGRTDLEFMWNIVTLLIMPVFIFIGAQFGIVWVTFFITIAMLILFFPSWKLLIFKLTGASFKEYFHACFQINPLRFVKFADIRK